MTRYRDGRGHAEGSLTEAILELVQAAGGEGLEKAALVADVLDRFPRATPKEVRRHLSRMKTGPYRGRIVEDPPRVFVWVG